MTINIPDNISIVLDKLHNAGYEAYLAGGCVRDGLMGREPSDYDITTNALPRQTAACFEDFTVIETGIKHGTVTVVSGGENVEITTYRIDGTYADHRRPDTVCFTPRLEDDLSRRDFTMNAMAYSPERGLVDKFGGQDDIIERNIFHDHFPAGNHTPLDHHPTLQTIMIFHQIPHGRQNIFLMPDLRQISQMSHIDAKQRELTPRQISRRLNQRSVTTQTDHAVYVLRHCPPIRIAVRRYHTSIPAKPIVAVQTDAPTALIGKKAANQIGCLLDTRLFAVYNQIEISHVLSNSL